MKFNNCACRFPSADKSSDQRDYVIELEISEEDYEKIIENLKYCNMDPENYMHDCIVSGLEYATIMEELRQLITEISREAEEQAQMIQAVLEKNQAYRELDPDNWESIENFLKDRNSIVRKCQEALNNGNL